MTTIAGKRRHRQPVPVAAYRISWISLMAAIVGVLAGCVAYLLYDMIGLFTNLAYYHEWSFSLPQPGT